MCPRNPSSHSLSSYASWDSLALDSVLPGAMSQHQMPHQLFLRGLRHPPFQFFRNPQPQLQAYLPDSLSLPPFFLFKKMRQAPNLLQTLTEGASGNRQGSARPRGPDGPPGGGQGAAEALTDILIEGIGGKQRHLHCVQRCPQGLPLTPQESGCDLGRKSPRAKTVAETDSPRPATTPALPDPQQPRQRRRRRQERRSREDPGRGACRESGCPGFRLSRTCPELAPQKPAQPQSPLRPDPL